MNVKDGLRMMCTWVWHSLGHHHNICVEGLRKIQETSVYVKWACRPILEPGNSAAFHYLNQEVLSDVFFAFQTRRIGGMNNKVDKN
jgi:hypothetical protein